MKLYVSHPVFPVPDIVKPSDTTSVSLGFLRVDYLEAKVIPKGNTCESVSKFDTPITVGTSQSNFAFARFLGVPLHGSCPNFNLANKTAIE